MYRPAPQFVVGLCPLGSASPPSFLPSILTEVVSFVTLRLFLAENLDIGIWIVALASAISSLQCVYK
jgi:type IV secretory pathway TrbD component